MVSITAFTEVHIVEKVKNPSKNTLFKGLHFTNAVSHPQKKITVYQKGFLTGKCDGYYYTRLSRQNTVNQT